MVENAQPSPIEEALAVLDAVLTGRRANDRLHNVKSQLLRMKEDPDYVPDYGRYLIDEESGEPFVTPLLEVTQWRRRALARRR